MEKSLEKIVSKYIAVPAGQRGLEQDDISADNMDDIHAITKDIRATAHGYAKADAGPATSKKAADMGYEITQDGLWKRIDVGIENDDVQENKKLKKFFMKENKKIIKNQIDEITLTRGKINMSDINNASVSELERIIEIMPGKIKKMKEAIKDTNNANDDEGKSLNKEAKFHLQQFTQILSKAKIELNKKKK